MEEYKNNSLKAQTEPKTEKPKMTPIVKGEVKKKDSLKSKVLSTFIHEDKESVIEYAIMDVVVPKLKEAAIDVVNGTLSMLFYGDAGKSRVNYNKSSSASYRQGQRTNYQQESTRSGTEGIILENRSDAIAVLNQLRDLVTDYDRATVADYYDLVGISSNFTDNNFGWTNLDSAYVSAVRGGYTVILPKARAL
jgi:hypothetical protein